MEEHLFEYLRSIEALNGEGVMLREPGSLYERRRCKVLQKVKTITDTEAMVVGFSNGALDCQSPTGVLFRVGSGLSNEQRRDPPSPGAIITYKHQGVTDSGKPRFPVFVCERVDATWPPTSEATVVDANEEGELHQAVPSGEAAQSGEEAAPSGAESAPSGLEGASDAGEERVTADATEDSTGP